jgi:hypothetical protein
MENELELTDLEKEFVKVYEEVHESIQEKIKQAAKLLKEATDIADQNGISFSPEVGIPFRISYIPDSLHDKFPNIDLEFVYELTNTNPGCYHGWQRSQVCN